jgi:hypothetical protein
VNILEELNALLAGLGVRVETGVFSDIAPLEYVVITPLGDSFQLFASDRPGYDQQEARLSLFTKPDKDSGATGNYMELKSNITTALLDADYTITDRRYIGHEDDTKYHHYGIDVAKIYALEN